MTARSARAVSPEFAADLKAAASGGPRRSANLLFYVIVLFLVAAVVWADHSTLDLVTVGQGRVIPSSQVQVVQNLEGGILSEILVAEGDIVAKGQVLLRIDDTTFASNFRENRARYLGLLGAVSRLEAEAAGKELKFPDELAFEAEILARERSLYGARKAELDASLQVMKSQEQQRRQEQLELGRRIEGLTQSVSLARQQLALLQPNVERGVAPRTDLLKLQREINDLEQELETSRLQVPRTASALQEAIQRQAERTTAFRSQAQSQINDLRTQLRALQEALTAVQDRVTRTEVRSPVYGTVQRLAINTIGGVIQPGKDLIEIVPIEDNLLIEARVRPADIAFLRPGQDAKVKLTAYDYGVYGTLPAKLELISADTITDDQGQSYYRVRVRTDRNHLGTDEAPLEILPGMVAQVDLLSGKRTVLQYLLTPVIRAQQNALRER